MAFTSHGHHVPGTPFNPEDRPENVARCGGSTICGKCAAESITIRAKFEARTEHLKTDRQMQIEALRRHINVQALDSLTNTPDHVLAEYLFTCLEAYSTATQRRVQWLAAPNFREITAEENPK